MTGNDYDLTALISDSVAGAGVAHSQLLIEFVDTILTASFPDAASVRQRVRNALGDAAFVDVCATVASFNAVVKIADGSGIPLEEAKAEISADIRADLGLNRFA